ncbi:predicted protein [Naegleria gruberi]|uniref:Predicted protein n=1 Tax=Naegleria gruberi TaxID=5762 RepID=D2VDF0_NAEGR|nr:uncharacterized protein NAEGRDRAFT_48597 [Naegleria gruberi]EFC45222.1 predicted protein [Naegleria gruberi]|eukprot:XP_002677966.1 predicted protein [Naegleria gruberi strain NEG-M]
MILKAIDRKMPPLRNSKYQNPKPRPSVEVLQKFAELDQRGASVNEYRKELYDYYSKEEWKTCYVPQLYAPWHGDDIFSKFSNYTKKIEELLDQDDSDWENIENDDQEDEKSSISSTNNQQQLFSDGNDTTSLKRKLDLTSQKQQLKGRFSSAKKLKLELLKAQLQERKEKELHDCLTENLESRFEYYCEHEIVRPGMDFFDDVRGGGHSIKLIFDFNKGFDPSEKPFAYTLGAHYWNRKCPEILALVDSSKHGFEAFTNVAKVLNMIVDMVDRKIFSLEEGLALNSILPMFTNDKLVMESVSSEERNEYFGYANWFYINFADMDSYPCLKVQFSVQDIDDIIEYNSVSISKSIFETDENVCMVKRGIVEEMPEIVPVSIPDHSPLGIILKSHKSRVILTKQVVTLHLDNEELFLKTAGMCEVESFKDYIAANPQFDILKKQAFEYAMWNNKLDNIRHLISLGYNLKGDGNLRSPLMDAVQYGFEEVVKILVENGAPLDDKDCENWTVLSIASKALLHSDMEKATRILQYLWDAGARIM